MLCCQAPRVPPKPFVHALRLILPWAGAAGVAGFALRAEVARLANGTVLAVPFRLAVAAALEGGHAWGGVEVAQGWRWHRGGRYVVRGAAKK